MDKSYGNYDSGNYDSENYDIENYDYNYEKEHSGNGIDTDIDTYNANKNTIQFLLILMIGLSCMPKWIEIGKYIFKSCKTSYKKKKFKIAWSPTLGYAKPEKEVLEKLNLAIKNIESLGHEVELVDKIFDKDPVDLWNAEFYAGVGTKLKQIIESNPDLIDPPILEVLKIAITQEMGNYYGSVFERYALREKMRVFFEKYDLLITPTLPCSAFKAGQNVPENFPDRNIVSWVYYTYPFNLTGQPAASINAGFSKNNLPIGMQIISNTNKEIDILNLSKQFEDNFLDLNNKPKF